MGSVFVTDSDKTVKGFGGVEYPVPFYLQFVAGYCVEAIHSDESLRYNGPNSINSIIALPHHTDKAYKTKASAGEEYRYYPLFRTMTDVPSNGDPVLLCTIGKIKYYLGPLNTTNNSPTWNDDPSFMGDPVFTYGGTDQKLGRISPRGERGESANFNKNIPFNRLTKKRKNGLDYGDTIFETTGDTIIEGRHGNSLRIGSRSNNPYVFLSNKRFPTNDLESLNDGGLISITSHGSLQQHFGDYYEGDLQFFNTGDDIFKLASDTIESQNVTIGEIWSDFNGGSESQEIYGYGFEDFDEEGEDANQILIQSDRITLNTKLDDVFISSKKDIYIGAGENISLTGNKTITFQTPNFNIGNSNKATMESMVLGDSLKEVLTDILALFSKIQVMTQLGPQNILPTTQPDIQSISTKIESITSTKHTIEQG